MRRLAWSLCAASERENGLVPRGAVELRGKAAPVPVYALGAAR